MQKHNRRNRNAWKAERNMAIPSNMVREHKINKIDHSLNPKGLT